ncbi:MAG: AAA family ATPase [Microbacterium enclense]
MGRVLITGMSGTGKSTVLAELEARGYRTVDTDYDGWTDGDGGPWDAARMADLLATESTVIVSGTSENQGDFSDRFEEVVLLSAPVEVVIDRVRSRTNNPYGRTAEQQEEIRASLEEVEPLLRRGATAELDARSSVKDLADAIALLAGPPSGAS